MSCHVCGQEAVERCFTCGQLFCPAHGTVNCVRCDGAIAVGDPRQDRITQGRMKPAESVSPWWRPQKAEDYRPPACYVCQGLTRSRCQQCERLYCPEHAGRNGWCNACSNDSRSLLLILGGVLLLFLLALLLVLL